MSRYRMGDKVRKSMGVRLTGKVIARIPHSQYTDGSYRAPLSHELAVYVEWLDGSRGWTHAAHLELA